MRIIAAIATMIIGSGLVVFSGLERAELGTAVAIVCGILGALIGFTGIYHLDQELASK